MAKKKGLKCSDYKGTLTRGDRYVLPKDLPEAEKPFRRPKSAKEQ